MSTTITGIKYSDPKLSAIRSQVNTKNDGIPYLLMPIKIETRFMKVDKPIFAYDPFPDVLGSIFKLKNYILFDPEILPPREVLGRIRNAIKKFNELDKIGGTVNRVNRKELGWLKDRAAILETEVSNLSSRLSDVRWDDEQLMGELRSLRPQLNTGVKAVSLSIAKNKVSRTSKFAESTTLLGNMENIQGALQKLATISPRAKTRNDKRRVFSKMENQMDLIEQNLKDIQVSSAVNMVSTSSQLKQLDGISEEIPELVKKAMNVFKKIDSDYKKNEYATRVEALNEKLKSFQEDLNTRVRPKIDMQLALRTIEAREVLYRTYAITDALNKWNENPFRSYGEIKSTRVKLYRQLHSLRDEMHRIVEGNQEEFDAISLVWEAIDDQLVTFTKRVRAFKGKDSGERAGISRTITHINKEYRRDLAGLKSHVKSAFPVLTNLSLEKSVLAYNDSLSRIKAVKEILNNDPNLKKRPTTAKQKRAVSEALGIVKALEKEIQIASRDIHVLPKKTFDALKAESEGLNASILRIIQDTGGIDNPSIPLKVLNETTRAASSIESEVAAQFTDTLDRKDRFYDEKRNGFVFAKKTVTQNELWVRFYPDDLAIHTHEEALTQEEVDAGKAYWMEIAASGDDESLKLAAWRAICAAYGSQRAAWIVKTMKPVPSGGGPFSDLLLANSKKIVKANKSILDLNTLLAGLNVAEDKDEALGVAYPYLTLIHDDLSKLESENATLLHKTRKSLLITQSHINGLIQELKSATREESIALRPRMEVVKQFANKFNRIIADFQKTKPLTSNEMIREVIPLNVFPTPTIRVGSWTEAPHTNVMPDKFVVLTYLNGAYQHIKVSNTVPDKLIVGLDPTKFESDGFEYDEDGNLLIDDKIKWLTDFKEAEKLGMALSIELTNDEVNAGFDKVFVLGVKDTTETEGQNLLEELIDNHHFLPEGASFLPIGTPTNNTQEGEAGYRSFEEDEALSFEIERNNENGDLHVANAEYPTDAERMSTGLGIEASTLRFLDYATKTDISDGFNMNKALFHGTLGNYMEEGMDTFFTLGNIEHTKTFFNNYVSARGYLPSIRFGTQPYGILPTTAFSQFQVSSNDSNPPTLTATDFENPAAIETELQERYDIRLKQLLDLLDNEWTTIRNEENVEHHGNTNANDPQGHFMKMLGLHAVSQESFYRYGLNVAARKGGNEVGDFNINFLEADYFGPNRVAQKFRNHMAGGYYFQSDSFKDETNPSNNAAQQQEAVLNRITTQVRDARVFGIRLLEDQSQILGDLVDSRELSDTVGTSSDPNAGTIEEKLAARAELENFIDWLTTKDAWDLHSQNKFSEITDEILSVEAPSKSLLFLLLRHSLLTAYVDAILKILEYEGLNNQKTRKVMGAPGFYFRKYASGFAYVSKWTYLFSKIGELDGVLGFNMDVENDFFKYIDGKKGTWKGYLNSYLSPADTSNPTVFEGYLFHNNHQPFVDALAATRNAIDKLKTIPTKKLERLMAEHLDLCTYRLDAWRLGLANQRLEKQRAQNDKGIYIGAYGWVEDLRKGDVRAAAENIPSGLYKNGDAAVYTDEDNQGFIHTPSLNHAIASAILRAGFKANEATREVDNQMAVNLSSERVRMALNLLDGINGGQDIAALMGYQFERGLHERYTHKGLELDEFIYDFREKFPLQVPVEGASEDLGDISMANVVDGIELLDKAQAYIEGLNPPPANGASIFEAIEPHLNDFILGLAIANITAASTAEKKAILLEIDRMANAFDALGDLCISESIYQVSKGNHVRASAILEKLAKGDVPNDIEITTTPRTGTVITHKVGLFIDRITGIDYALVDGGAHSSPIDGTDLAIAVNSAAAAATGWTSDFTPRALAEPSLNKWVGGLIGDPSQIKCMVNYTIPEYEVGEVTTPAHELEVTVRFIDLNLQPLDFLHLFGSGPLDGGAELNDRVAVIVKSAIVLPVDYPGDVDDLPIHIKYMERSASWAVGDFSFYEKAGLIQSIRVLITNSAIFGADDLAIPGEEEIPSEQIRYQNVDELLIRATNLEARLRSLRDQFQNFWDTEISLQTVEGHTFISTQIDDLRLLLKEASNFGIPGTIPESTVDYGNEIGLRLLQYADGAFKAIEQRLTAAAKNTENGKLVSSSNEARIDALREACRDILGKAFMVFPHFTVRNSMAVTDQLSLAQNKGLLRSSSDFAMEEWSQGISRVRERMASLETVEMLVENFGAESHDKRVLQLPFEMDGDTAKDHWLGIEFPLDYTAEEDKLSIVVLNSGVLMSNTTDTKLALLVDEWVEIIPNQNETTAIAFNYDQPDAKPPNNMLLVVTPQETGSWTWDNLVHTLNDTLELAKNRAVEPAHLENTVFGQILPGIMTEIVPPQLIPAEGEGGQTNPLGLQVISNFGTVNDTYEKETEDE